MMWRAASELVTCDGMGSVTVQRLFRLCFFSRQQRASEVGLSLVGSGMCIRGRLIAEGTDGPEIQDCSSPRVPMALNSRIAHR